MLQKRTKCFEIKVTYNFSWHIIWEFQMEVEIINRLLKGNFLMLIYILYLNSICKSKQYNFYVTGIDPHVLNNSISIGSFYHYHYVYLLCTVKRISYFCDSLHLSWTQKQWTRNYLDQFKCQNSLCTKNMELSDFLVTITLCFTHSFFMLFLNSFLYILYYMF